MSQQTVIRPETPDDHGAIRKIHDAAFGDGDGIPELVDDLRAQIGGFHTASLVAETSGGDLVGHVMLSHAWVDSNSKLIDVMVLSPLGVVPSSQNQGVGSALIAEALATANTYGAPMVFLEGNHRFYGPRGFTKAMAHGFRRPSLRIPENAFQVALLPAFNETMTGTFVYRDVHWKHGVGLYRTK